MSLILEEALKLTVAERIKLADRLYESVGAANGFSLTDEQIGELERRIKDYEQNPDATIPWEEVRDRWRKLT